ncbi:MAG TPA: hypothetical protein VGS19_29020 [Streptosporangiaceae bacterium]|nr:hypothetical protein [Streptosporangiaceae bacterium]
MPIAKTDLEFRTRWEYQFDEHEAADTGPSQSLATSREARAAACQPPQVITLAAVPGEPGTFGQLAIEPPEPLGVPTKPRAEAGTGPGRTATAVRSGVGLPPSQGHGTPAPGQLLRGPGQAATTRCRRCKYAKARCCCPTGPRG